MVAVDRDVRHAAYRAWLEAGYHAEMAYMAEPDRVAARIDPSRVLDGARSLVVVAAAYGPDNDAPDDARLRGRVARYARGGDYHHALRRALDQLAASLASELGGGFAARPCVDSAPVLERGYAEAAGLGFVGKNTMLISPGLGSYTVLGELLTDLEIAETPRLAGGSRCGDCRACIDACPTGAIAAPWALDARRCISQLTIEHRGAIEASLRPAIGDMIFGCDVCQEVCPYNAAAPARHPAFDGLAGGPEDAFPDLVELAAMGSNAWKRWSGGRATRRAGRAGLMRNVAIALGNSGDDRARPPLERLAGDRSEVVRDAASWALARLAESVDSDDS